MLDITTITRQNVTSVVGYYSDAKDDYYSKDSSFTSWQGTGAEALGLSGDVESARFKELLVGEIDTFTHMQLMKKLLPLLCVKLKNSRRPGRLARGNQ